MKSQPEERRYSSLEQILKTYIPDYQDEEDQVLHGDEVGKQIADKLVGQIEKSLQRTPAQRPLACR
jgi:hypothetical protein